MVATLVDEVRSESRQAYFTWKFQEVYEVEKKEKSNFGGSLPNVKKEYL
jgi:hypothetical protein